MFKVVENELELVMFNGIWTTVWAEKGYELEYSKQFLERYVVITEEGRYVGTAEIKPFSQESYINEVCDFQDHPLIANGSGAVAEIDKLAVLSSHRGPYVAELLSAAVQFAEIHRLNCFVALLEPMLIRALRISYHVPVERLSDRVLYKGGDVIPAIVHAEEVYTHRSRYSWLIS